MDYVVLEKLIRAVSSEQKIKLCLFLPNVFNFNYN